MPDGEQRIAVMVNPAKPGEEEIPTEYFLTMQNKATKNTFIFGEREDVSIGEAGWEPGRGRIRPEQTADGKQVNKAPAKKRMPRFTGTVNVCAGFRFGSSTTAHSVNNSTNAILRRALIASPTGASCVAETQRQQSLSEGESRQYARQITY
jgi:hypothetical protein